MLVFNSQPKLLNAKLTAIWAVSESGLGGLLHAAKIPFSGIFLGSFAVIIITYLAQSNTNRFNTIIKATLLVVLIKAMVSPHSPPMAYVAVLFQGVVGASIYGAFGVNRLSTISFGAIALFESAFQKILTLTIVFGMGLWESILQFFEGMQNRLHADWISDVPLFFLIVYGLLYVIVGIMAGSIAFRLPKKVLNKAEHLRALDLTNDFAKPSPKRSKRKRFMLIGGLLVFAITVFLISGMPNKALYLVLRTLGAVIFFLFLFNPLFKYLIQKWVEKRKDKEKKSLDAIVELMPIIRNNVGLAQKLVGPERNAFKRTKHFLINWLSLSLYYSQDDA